MPAMIVGDAVIYGTAGADWGGEGWIGAFKRNCPGSLRKN
jgi:alcohol dehydrogenase (cytochrome c)